MTSDYQKTAHRSDVKPNELLLVQVGERQILLTELDGQVIAFDNMCTHEECDLLYGAIDDINEIECDCHGARFNVLTGEVASPPAEIPLPIYNISVNDSYVYVGPRKN